MTTVALVGGDGAGKTSVARRLCADPRLRTRYMYMGMSAQSGDHLLPTSRLMLGLRRRSHRRRTGGEASGGTEPGRIPAADYEYSGRKRSALWVAARLANRLAEAWYRQLISLAYQARGYLVIYDRHVLLDAGTLDPGRSHRRLPERVYHRLMRGLFPRPDLVIFLDASGRVLHSRKGEASPDYLDREARMYAAQAGAVHRFERIDAGRPLDEVTEEAMHLIAEATPTVFADHLPPMGLR
ncbi:MAG: hypothetical protein ACLFWM_01900 [Actinomycetota bacterium]